MPARSPGPAPAANGDRLHPTVVVVLHLAAMGPHRLIVSSTLLPDPLLAQHLGTVVLVPGALERLPSRGEALLETPSCPEQSRERTGFTDGEVQSLDHQDPVATVRHAARAQRVTRDHTCQLDRATEE
jgi:hypothetical protein